MIVTYYILKKVKNLSYKDPFELIESISVGNFGKFSIESGNNQDYAGDSQKLKFSLPYVKVDLSVLKPEIIIMPRTIYNAEEVKKEIGSILPNVQVIPIYQINARTINRIIARNFERKERREVAEFYEWQRNLSNGITGKTNENFLAVYTYLDSVISDIGGSAVVV